jgi:hypothetical protein
LTPPTRTPPPSCTCRPRPCHQLLPPLVGQQDVRVAAGRGRRVTIQSAAERRPKPRSARGGRGCPWRRPW